MERNRLLELALESLNQQKKSIDDGIAAIQRELKAAGAARDISTAPALSRRRGKRTAAERKAQSLAMKEAWKRRKAAEAENKEN